MDACHTGQVHLDAFVYILVYIASDMLFFVLVKHTNKNTFFWVNDVRPFHLKTIYLLHENNLGMQKGVGNYR